ncbi:MAG: hypothetical protein J0L92_33480 [Deltaproteobacteria bacterium]|nr:hypothetical protein [Deltaproteobacteria bacterium]
MDRRELFELTKNVASTLAKDERVRNLPLKTAGGAVLGRVLTFGVAPIAIAFAAGTLVGAGAMLFLAPGGEAMRSAAGDQLKKILARLQPEVVTPPVGAIA